MKIRNVLLFVLCMCLISCARYHTRLFEMENVSIYKKDYRGRVAHPLAVGSEYETQTFRLNCSYYLLDSIRHRRTWNDGEDRFQPPLERQKGGIDKR